MSLSAFTDELAQVRTKKNEIEKFSTANHSGNTRLILASYAVLPLLFSIFTCIIFPLSEIKIHSIESHGYWSIYPIKMLWQLSREAIRYKTLYVIAILSTLALTGINLAAPKVLSAMTGIVERGVDEAGLERIGVLTAVLLGLYLLRVLFRFLSSYLSHKAAWYLVGDLRTKVYDKLERMHLGYFHDKQTGDLMSRVVNDTRDFELLYAHMIPESITNLLSGGLRRAHSLS